MPTGSSPTDIVTFSQVIRDYGPAIAWLLVIIGWWITNDQANNREKRKETRVELDRLAQMIRQLVEDYNRYITSTPQSPEEQQYAVSIKANFQRISTVLERQSTRLDLTYAKSLFAEFYDMITGGDFEANTRKAKTTNDPVFTVTAAFAEKIIDHIERGFISHFS